MPSSVFCIELQCVEVSVTVCVEVCVALCLQSVAVCFRVWNDLQ